MKTSVLTLITILVCASFAYGQENDTNKVNNTPASSENDAGDDEKKYNSGVTVTPSHLDFSADLGETQIKKIKVTNFTSTARKFEVNYFDFDISYLGKSEFLDKGSSKHSLNPYLSISPSFMELQPGEVQEVILTVSIPNIDSVNAAFWGVLMLEEAKEKKTLEPAKPGDETIAFGVIPTFAFGIWLYQNPPNVEVSAVEIENFMLEQLEANNMLNLEVKNTGDGISFCYAYLEITNLETGEQFTLGGKRYTILPSYNRKFAFELAKNLPKGRYSAVGVVDYYSDNEVVAAELEFELK